MLSEAMVPILVATAAAAPELGGATFEIENVTFCGGGVINANGASYQLSATVGEAVVGTSAGPNFEVSLGFWAAVGAGASIVADFDGDGDVDTADFAVFAQCFGGSLNPPAAGCPAGVDADFDDDGDVDTADFATFAQQFTGAM